MSSGELSRINHQTNNLTMEVKLLADRYERLVEDKKELEEKLEKNEERLDKFEAMANHWKGGFVVVVALGGLIGWVSSNLETVMKFLGKGGN